MRHVTFIRPATFMIVAARWRDSGEENMCFIDSIRQTLCILVMIQSCETSSMAWWPVITYGTLRWSNVSMDYVVSLFITISVSLRDSVYTHSVVKQHRGWETKKSPSITRPCCILIYAVAYTVPTWGCLGVTVWVCRRKTLQRTPLLANQSVDCFTQSRFQTGWQSYA